MEDREAMSDFDPSTAKPLADTDGPALAQWITKSSPGVKASYRSTAADRIVTAFKADDIAGVLMHSERVMPKSVRKGIHREWSRAKARGEAKGTPGDFLAANGAQILNGRFTGRGSWRAEAKKWLSDAAEHISRTAGVRGDAQIHQRLSGILGKAK